MMTIIIMPSPLGPGGKPRQKDPLAKHNAENSRVIALYKDDGNYKVATVTAIPEKNNKDGVLTIEVSIPPERRGNQWGIPIRMDNVYVASHFFSGNGKKLLQGALKVGDAVLCKVERIINPNPDEYAGKYLKELRAVGTSYVAVLIVMAKL